MSEEQTEENCEAILFEFNEKSLISGRRIVECDDEPSPNNHLHVQPMNACEVAQYDCMT